MAEAYPLSWPEGWPRTDPRKRERAKFSSSTTQYSQSGGSWRQARRLTVAEGLRRLHNELIRLEARSVTISTNVELRLDGAPRSDRRPPEDPGVAVYFTLGDLSNGKPHCLPCDRWDSVADNLAAVAAHVEAMRGMARWGVGDMSAIFAGYRALPPKGGTTVGTGGPHWSHVLGVREDAPLDVVQGAYRALARKYHPDAGGDVGAMASINRAWEQAQAAVRR